MSNKIKRAIYIVLAFICVGLGAIGVVLPVLPTTPFLLLAVVLFERGSDRFHQWFMTTNLYKKHLEEFVRTKSMTLKKKLTILLPVSAILILVFFTVPSPHAKIAIVVAFILKYYYFFFRIRTIK
ncbi:MAG: YbaN family protein [bacterium]|nr:YbaN family protein [bacterium]